MAPTSLPRRHSLDKSLNLNFLCRKRCPISDFLYLKWLIFPKHDLLLVLIQRQWFRKLTFVSLKIFHFASFKSFSVVCFLNISCSHFWLQGTPWWMWFYKDYFLRDMEKDQNCHHSVIWTVCSCFVELW